MKKFTYFLLLISTCILSCSTEADVEPGSSDTFIKFLGDINNDAAEDMKPTPDGGFIFLGTNRTESAEEETDRIHLIKTDEFGNIEWERLYPEVVNIPEGEEGTNLTGRSVLALENGYIVAGDSIYGEGSSNLYMLRVGLDGSVMNDATLALPQGNLKGQVVESTTTGNFLVLGSIENNTAPENMYLAEVDTDFNLVWEQQYGLGDDANVSKSLYTDEQEITWAGTTIRNQNEQDIRFLSTPFDSKNTFFDETLGLNNDRNEIGTDIKRSPTGYVIVGTTNNTGNGDEDVFLISIGTNGGVLWSRSFGGSSNDTGESVIVTSDGQIVALGTTESFGNGERDLYLIKTDLKGNPLWGNPSDINGPQGLTFGGLNDEIGARVLETTDKGFLLLGTEDFNDVGTMIVIKTDQDGNL